MAENITAMAEKHDVDHTKLDIAIREHAAGLVRMYHDFDRDITNIREQLDQWSYAEESPGDETATGTYTIPEDRSIGAEEAVQQKILPTKSTTYR